MRLPTDDAAKGEESSDKKKITKSVPLAGAFADTDSGPRATFTEVLKYTAQTSSKPFTGIARPA